MVILIIIIVLFLFFGLRSIFAGMDKDVAVSNYRKTNNLSCFYPYFEDACLLGPSGLVIVQINADNALIQFLFFDSDKRIDNIFSYMQSCSLDLHSQTGSDFVQHILETELFPGIAGLHRYKTEIFEDLFHALRKTTNDNYIMESHLHLPPEATNNACIVAKALQEDIKEKYPSLYDHSQADDTIVAFGFGK